MMQPAQAPSQREQSFEAKDQDDQMDDHEEEHEEAQVSEVEEDFLVHLDPITARKSPRRFTVASRFFCTH